MACPARYALAFWLIFAVAAPAQAPRGMFEGGRVYSLDETRRECIEFSAMKIGTNDIDARECAVSTSGEIGVVDGITYDYALYCVIPGYADPGRCDDGSHTALYHARRGAAIFAREGGGARVVFERVDREIGSMVFRDPPQLRPHPAGTILYIPMQVDGTGVFNESEYYLRREGRWERLDYDSWQADLGTRLPKGLEIWKGIWLDLKTLRATPGLYRAGDANCCPSGGTAEIQLGIRDRRFVIESVNVTR